MILDDSACEAALLSSRNSLQLPGEGLNQSVPQIRLHVDFSGTSAPMLAPPNLHLSL